MPKYPLCLWNFPSARRGTCCCSGLCFTLTTFVRGRGAQGWSLLTHRSLPLPWWIKMRDRLNACPLTKDRDPSAQSLEQWVLTWPQKCQHYRGQITIAAPRVLLMSWITVRVQLSITHKPLPQLGSADVPSDRKHSGCPRQHLLQVWCHRCDKNAKALGAIKPGEARRKKSPQIQVWGSVGFFFLNF